MNSKRRGLLWIDHHGAHLITLAGESAEFTTSSVAGDEGHVHDPKHGGGHRHALSSPFAARVARALEELEEVIVAGPSTAKDELIEQLHHHHPRLPERVVLMMKSDRRTDGQLAREARSAFLRLDRLRHLGLPLT